MAGSFTTLMAMMKPDIDEETCMGCGLCKDACDFMREGYECLVLKNGIMCCPDEGECLASQPACGQKCIQLCPTKAFKLVPA